MNLLSPLPASEEYSTKFLCNRYYKRNKMEQEGFGETPCGDVPPEVLLKEKVRHNSTALLNQRLFRTN